MDNFEIDRQHKELFELGQRLTRLLGATSPRFEHLHEALNDFTESTFEHFAAEEKLLTRNACPLLTKHKAEHDGYIDDLNNTLNEFLSRRIDKPALLELLLDLLGKHLVDMDLLCKEYLKDTHH